MSEWGDFGGLNWEAQDDLTSLPENELRGILEALAVEEQQISYRRRILQGRIDLIRSEIVRRGGSSVSPEELARALMDGLPGEAVPFVEKDRHE